MKPSTARGWSLIAWLAVAAFWLVATRNHHPTWLLAVIVTASLIVAYASAAYVNHLVLIPRYAKTRHYGRYVLWLLATMAVFTGVALTIIRASYSALQGPDPDPYGAYIHYGIDFFGMVVHVVGAAAVVRGFEWYKL
jgi:hypothetical protein